MTAIQRWKRGGESMEFHLDRNVDVSVFLFDCNPRAMRGTDSPMAIGK